MPVGDVHGQYPVKVHADGMGAAVVLRGIERQSLSTGTEVRTESTSGEVYACYQGIYAVKPLASFETKHIGSGLALTGGSGLRIASATNPGLTFYAQKQQEGGSRASGSVHKSYTIREGLLIPRTLRCEHQGDATLGFEVLVTYDGTNDPIVLAETASLPSSSDVCHRFTLGPVSLADIAFPQIRSIDIDFGVAAETIDADSDLSPTSSRIIEVMPRLNLRGINNAWFSAAKIPLTGLISEHADPSVVVLRQRKIGSSFYGPEEEKHITLSVNGLAYVDTAHDAQGNALSESTISVPLIFDGTNAPIVIEFDQAYA